MPQCAGPSVFIKQKEPGHFCPGSMKTPKTLLTNLMKTTFFKIGLTDLDGFYQGLGFFFFAKRHVQNTFVVNSGNCFLVHCFG